MKCAFVFYGSFFFLIIFILENCVSLCLDSIKLFGLLFVWFLLDIGFKVYFGFCFFTFIVSWHLLEVG